VLCVDDNDFVAEALRRKVTHTTGFRWAGWLPSAHDLVATVREGGVDVVLLDLDMPGKDAFEALREVASLYPDVRVVILSGYVRADYIDRAVEAGAWGYISKNESTDTIMQAVRNAAAGAFAFGPDVEAEMRRRPQS
jgi:two-component system invasion response regulator UvrY